MFGFVKTSPEGSETAAEGVTAERPRRARRSEAVASSRASAHCTHFRGTFANACCRCRGLGGERGQ